MSFYGFPAPSEGGRTSEFFNLFKHIFIWHLGYAANIASGACLFLTPPPRCHPSSLKPAVGKQLTRDVGGLQVSWLSWFYSWCSSCQLEPRRHFGVLVAIWWLKMKEDSLKGQFYMSLQPPVSHHNCTVMHLVQGLYSNDY